MRFLMINLILVCLLLFGIGYLAFGDTETVLELHAHSLDETSFEASQELLKTDWETTHCRTFTFLTK